MHISKCTLEARVAMVTSHGWRHGHAMAPLQWHHNFEERIVAIVMQSVGKYCSYGNTSVWETWLDNAGVFESVCSVCTDMTSDMTELLTKRPTASIALTALKLWLQEKKNQGQVAINNRIHELFLPEHHWRCVSSQRLNKYTKKHGAHTRTNIVAKLTPTQPSRGFHGNKDMDFVLVMMQLIQNHNSFWWHCVWFVIFSTHRCDSGLFMTCRSAFKSLLDGVWHWWQHNSIILCFYSSYSTNMNNYL